jgi:phospholipid transport system substrate-binding protein
MSAGCGIDRQPLVTIYRSLFVSSRYRRKTMNTLNRRTLVRFLTASLSLALLVSAPLARAAADEAPDALIKRVSAEVLDAIKSDKSVQAGDMSKVIALVDTKVMPNVNFTRMTAAAVGRNWRQATPEQKARLQEEFKILLVRTYSGALSQVNDQRLNVKPLRAAEADTEVVVRTEVLGRGDPVQLDYRMEKTPSGWKIYDLNVLGVWLVETYRTQFAQEINAKGVDGLIASLAQRNKSNAGEQKPQQKS